MPTITIEPATIDRFDDVQHAFAGGGDGMGCQCQWFTITNAGGSCTGATRVYFGYTDV